jgi:hypothetical protein
VSDPRPADAMATLRELLGAVELVDAIDGLIKQRIAETLKGYPFQFDRDGNLLVNTRNR